MSQRGRQEGGYVKRTWTWRGKVKSIILAGFLTLNTVGSGGRGKGKRRFAPQGLWRKSSGLYQDEGYFPILQRPHNIPFPPPPLMAGKGEDRKSRSMDEYYLVDKAWELWGPNSSNIFNKEVIESVFQNLKKLK